MCFQISTNNTEDVQNHTTKVIQKFEEQKKMAEELSGKNIIFVLGMSLFFIILIYLFPPCQKLLVHLWFQAFLERNEFVFCVNIELLAKHHEFLSHYYNIS